MPSGSRTAGSEASVMGLWARQGITGIVLGAVVFALLFVPIVAWQYRRYGRGNAARLLGAAACALLGSALVAYTLLPLPQTTAQWCAEHAIRHARLTPGNSVRDMLAETAGMSAGQVLRSYAFLQIVLNVLLFVPVGVILRRYLGRSVLGSTLIGLCISIFIELTQYTGLWGLAGCAYRLADIDDVITNTLGALVGALIAPVLLWWMPKASKLAASRRAPRPVSGPRRVAGQLIDIAAFALVSVGSVATVAVLAAAGLNLLPDGRTRTSDLVLTVVIPALVTIVAPACTPSAASIGQRVVWLRPALTGAEAARPRLGRRLLRVASSSLLVAAAYGAGVLSTSAADEVSGAWMTGVLGLIGVLLLAALADPQHRGVSGRVAGLIYVDVRSEPAERAPEEMSGMAVDRVRD